MAICKKTRKSIIMKAGSGERMCKKMIIHKQYKRHSRYTDKEYIKHSTVLVEDWLLFGFILLYRKEVAIG